MCLRVDTYTTTIKLFYEIPVNMAVVYAYTATNKLFHQIQSSYTINNPPYICILMKLSVGRWLQIYTTHLTYTVKSILSVGHWLHIYNPPYRYRLIIFVSQLVTTNIQPTIQIQVNPFCQLVCDYIYITHHTDKG